MILQSKKLPNQIASDVMVILHEKGIQFTWDFVQPEAPKYEFSHMVITILSGTAEEFTEIVNQVENTRLVKHSNVDTVLDMLDEKDIEYDYDVLLFENNHSEPIRITCINPRDKETFNKIINKHGWEKI